MLLYTGGKMKGRRCFGLFVAGMVAIALLSTCSRTEKNVRIPSSVDCRGYDFDKKFPGITSKPPFANFAYYDVDRKRISNKEGLFFRIDYGKDDPRSHRPTYNEDLPHSAKEQAYLAAYETREKDFDARYAGVIKAKLNALADLYQITIPGVLSYPRYLEEEQLPEGITLPAYYFHWRTFLAHIRSQKLYKFIEKIGGHDFVRNGLAANMTELILEQVEDRIQALYVEYVLTWYHLKEYATPAERSRVVRDMTAYYSEVAFRGAAEATHRFAHWLSARERCLIADFVAHQVAGQVSLMDDPEGLARFQRRYRALLDRMCYDYLYVTRIDKFRHEMSTKVYLEKVESFKREFSYSPNSCVNN